MPTAPGGNAASEWTVGDLLTHGGTVAAGEALANAANKDYLIECGGDSTLVVEADLTAALAADLAVQVNPVDEYGTVSGVAQPAVSTVGPTLVAGHSYFWGEYDVRSQNRVRVRITNNNAAPQTLKASWRLS